MKFSPPDTRWDSFEQHEGVCWSFYRQPEAPTVVLCFDCHEAPVESGSLRCLPCGWRREIRSLRVG